MLVHFSNLDIYLYMFGLSIRFFFQKYFKMTEASHLASSRANFHQLSCWTNDSTTVSEKNSYYLYL